MHSLLARRGGSERASSSSTFRKLVRAEGGASERVRVCVFAYVRSAARFLLTHSLARSPGVSGRASPMYFLPWIEAINLLKCSWPDILLVPLIDGRGGIRKWFVLLPPPSPYSKKFLV